MKEKIKCPICERDLEYTTNGHYKTLSEHVCNPNGTPSLKAGYTCSYKYCIANNLGAIWIESGEMYMKPPDGVGWVVAHNIMEKCSKDGNYHAINSWNRHYDLGTKLVEKRTRTLDLGKFKIDFIPKTYGHKYDESKCYMPRRWGWNFQYWRRSEHGYTSIMPISRMVIFSINQFNQKYKQILYNPEKNKNTIKEAIEYARGYRFGQSDERLYVKVSSFLINIFYPAKVKNLKKFEKLLI